jgi:TatD DNase family protein
VDVGKKCKYGISYILTNLFFGSQPKLPRVYNWSMNLIDTHCHLHDTEFFKSEDAEVALEASVKAGVKKMIGIATCLEDSKRAIEFAKAHPENYWASIGIHPHEVGKLSEKQIDEHLVKLETLTKNGKVVAVGECGFDFYYNDRSELLKRQTQLLRGQLEIAKKYKLPVSFHVREAFDDFWPVYDQFQVPGVLHSFTDRPAHLKKALERGLLIGLNGIATFTSHEWQKELFKNMPLENVVIETDSPFLTPHPKRGTINTPSNVIYITRYLAELRGDDESTIATTTTANARKLFRI